MTDTILTTDFGRVRAARPEDTPRLVEMIGALARHHGDTPTVTDDDLTRDLFADPPWITVLVAEAGAGLIGYAALWPLIQLQYGHRGMDLHHLFVAPEARGAGVGRDLVAGCKIKARSLSAAYLTVGALADNLRAQAFYQALGFQRREARAVQFAVRL